MTEATKEDSEIVYKETFRVFRIVILHGFRMNFLYIKFSVKMLKDVFQQRK